jgi:hypothetical protein
MANELYALTTPATASFTENPVLYSIHQIFPYDLYTSQSAQFNLTVKTWTGDDTGGLYGRVNEQTYFLSAIPNRPTANINNPAVLFDLSPILDSAVRNQPKDGGGDTRIGSLPLQSGLANTLSENQGVWYEVEYSASYIDTSTNSRTYFGDGGDQVRWAQQGYIVNDEFQNSYNNRVYEWSWARSGVTFPILQATPINTNGDFLNYGADNYYLQRDNWKWKDFWPITTQADVTGESLYSPVDPYEYSYTFDPLDTYLRILTNFGEQVAVPMGYSSPNGASNLQMETFWVAGNPGWDFGATFLPHYLAADWILVFTASITTGLPTSPITRINKRCPQKNEVPQRIFYRNRVGAMDWFDFPGYAKESFELTRDLYTKSKLLNSFGSTTKYGGETNVFSVNGYNTIQLNTGFLRQWERQKLEEILLSDEIYLYMLDLQYVDADTPITDMPLQPLSIVDTNIQFKSDREDKVQQNYTLTFRYDTKYKTTF